MTNEVQLFFPMMVCRWRLHTEFTIKTPWADRGDGPVILFYEIREPVPTVLFIDADV